MAKVDWNASDYHGSGFEALPKGRYLCLVSDSELKDTKDKRGKYFEMEFDVVRPEGFKNRKLWARLNVHNPSETAQRIGREQWTALCEACGFDAKAVDDSMKLHGKPVIVIADVEDGTRGPVNRVTGFLKPGGDDAKAASTHKAAPSNKGSKPSASEAAAAREAERKQRQEAGQPVDDDIPF